MSSATCKFKDKIRSISYIAKETIQQFEKKIIQEFKLGTCKMIGIKDAQGKTLTTGQHSTYFISDCKIPKCINIVGTAATELNESMSKHIQAEAKAAILDIDEEHCDIIRLQMMKKDIEPIELTYAQHCRKYQYINLDTLSNLERKCLVEFACLQGNYEKLTHTSILGGQGKDRVDMTTAMYFLIMYDRRDMIHYLFENENQHITKCYENKLPLVHFDALTTKNLNTLAQSERTSANTAGGTSYKRHRGHYDIGSTYRIFRNQTPYKEVEYILNACRFGRLHLVHKFIEDFKSLIYPLGIPFWQLCIDTALNHGQLNIAQSCINLANNNIDDNNEIPCWYNQQQLRTCMKKGYFTSGRIIISTMKNYQAATTTMIENNIVIGNNNINEYVWILIEFCLQGSESHGLSDEYIFRQLKWYFDSIMKQLSDAKDVAEKPNIFTWILRDFNSLISSGSVDAKKSYFDLLNNTGGDDDNGYGLNSKELFFMKMIEFIVSQYSILFNKMNIDTTFLTDLVKSASESCNYFLWKKLVELEIKYNNNGYSTIESNHDPLSTNSTNSTSILSYRVKKSKNSNGTRSNLIIESKDLIGTLSLDSDDSNMEESEDGEEDLLKKEMKYLFNITLNQYKLLHSLDTGHHDNIQDSIILTTKMKLRMDYVSKLCETITFNFKDPFDIITTNNKEIDYHSSLSFLTCVKKMQYLISSGGLPCFSMVELHEDQQKCIAWAHYLQMQLESGVSRYLDIMNSWSDRNIESLKFATRLIVEYVVFYENGRFHENSIIQEYIPKTIIDKIRKGESQTTM